MFVSNYSSLPSDVVWVDKEEKSFLESRGFCALSFNGKKYGFTKTDDLLNTLFSWKGGKDG